MKIVAIHITWLYLILFASLSNAETVRLTSSAGRVIAADYTQGTNSANPIMLLHGFLQTNKFSTVDRLMNSLVDSEYTVLNPTLSLGLNDRKQSLSCEAIHMHSLDSDADEVRQWIEWLYKKTGKPVIVIGHSAGGAVILKYMELNNAQYIKHSVLISMTYYKSNSAINEKDKYEEKALGAVNSGVNPLDTYALGYCKTYPTRAKDFLSYYQWDKTKTNSIVGKHRDRISIILGTDDKRIDSDWRQELQQQYKNVITVEGANHFFDEAYEFDLIDAIEKLLAEHTEH